MAITKPYTAQILDDSPLSAGVLRTQGDKNTDVVSVKDFGAVGDGVADATVVLGTAVASGGVDGPNGTYLVAANNSTGGFTTATDSGLYGRGDKSVVELRELSATGVSEFAVMGGAGFLLERIKLVFTKALTGVSTALLLKTRFSRILLRNVTIDGQTALVAGTQDRSIQVIKSHNGAATDTVEIIGSDISGVSRVYTRDNADTDTQKIVKVALNKFRQMWRTVLTMNAPSGAIEDVLVVGNTFDTHAATAQGDTGVAGNNNAVGFEGVLGGRVIGNHVSGPYGALIHVEENTDGVAVVGNTARLALPSAADAAMETLANNIGGVAVTPTHLAHVANVLRSTDGVGTGMQVQSSVASDGAHWSLYSGNIVAGFDDAFKLSTDARSVLVADNVLRGTTNALDLTRASLLVRGNVLDNSTVLINAARGGFVGKQHFVNLSGATAGMTAFGAATAGPLSLRGFTWESNLFTGITGANDINLGPMPTRMIGCRLYVALVAGATSHRVGVFDVSYDGVTVTNTAVGAAYGSGTITLNGIVNNAGQLAVRFTDSGGPTASIRLQVDIDGVIVI